LGGPIGDIVTKRCGYTVAIWKGAGGNMEGRKEGEKE
jgi:hypothetical protein